MREGPVVTAGRGWDGRFMPRRPGPPSSAQRNALPLPAVHLAREYSAATVKQRLRTGEWLRVRPGAFVDAAPMAALTSLDRKRAWALAHAVAVHRTLTVPHALSHTSAALVHGLPLISLPTTTHITQAQRRSGTDARDLTRHRLPLPPEACEEHRGLRVTNLERTAVDCAMLLPADSGLVVVDAALHLGADPGALTGLLAQRSGRHGVPRARAVLELADAGAESAGESLLRFTVVRAGLPAPVTQLEVRTSAGTYWADLGWPEHRVLLEFDGLVKYRSTSGANDVVVREKLRQDALEAAGWRVLRVTYADLKAPRALIERVRLALGVGRTRRTAALG